MTDTEITAAIAWAQGYNNKLKLIFSRDNKDTLKTLADNLKTLNYTSYVLIYDPNNENVNALDGAINASIDYEVSQGSINFNFQPAVGYTPITTLGTVQDYQAGENNESLGDELDARNISYVYSVGVGEQQQILYGLGRMNGDFRLESTQANEAWLVKALQTAIMNAFITLPKIQLRGTASINTLSSIINPIFNQALLNGTMTQGTLSNLDKTSIINNTGNIEAPSSVENNGFYYQIEPLSDEDIANQRVRILVCYLAAGVINKVRIINNIYGA